MTFMDLFKDIPGFTDFVAGMPNVWPISMLQDIYAPFGALHLVGLGLMGGAVLLLNLRLMGTNLTNQTLPDVERSTRPWLIAGLAIVLGTGIIIGMLNSYKLYTSVPFFVKIMALIGACIFSFGVSNALAKAEGKPSTGVMIAGAIAIAFWLVSLGVFQGDAISSAGLFHPISAGYAILLIYGVRTRWLAAAAFALLFGGLFLMYAVVGFDTYEPMYDTVAYSVTIAGALIMAALYGVEIWLGRAEAASPTAKLVALFSVLCWVTVAAGGRWVGFAA
jgi:hypothetical protein